MLPIFFDFWLKLRRVEAGESQIFSIEIRRVNWSFPYFSWYQLYIFPIDWEYFSQKWWSCLWFSGSPWHFMNRIQAPTSKLFWEIWSTPKTYFGLSAADVGSQKSFIKSVTFAWHGGETLGTFWNGLFVASSLLFVEIIRFSGSHEAYLLSHASHQYNFCSRWSVI